MSGFRSVAAIADAVNAGRISATEVVTDMVDGGNGARTVCNDDNDRATLAHSLNGMGQCGITVGIEA